jgi:hypothetical protein
MTLQEKIDEALAVAVQAIPQFINHPVPDPEEYRVRLSADVTAYCRREGLLTATEFVSYGAWYSVDGWSKMIPHIYDDEGRKHLAGVPALTGARQHVPLPPCEELQEEFMASKPLLHPLRRYVSPFRSTNESGLGSRSLIG